MPSGGLEGFGSGTFGKPEVTASGISQACLDSFSSVAATHFGRHTLNSQRLHLPVEIITRRCTPYVPVRRSGVFHCPIRLRSREYGRIFLPCGWRLAEQVSPPSTTCQLFSYIRCSSYTHDHEKQMLDRVSREPCLYLGCSLVELVAIDATRSVHTLLTQETELTRLSQRIQRSL